MKAIAIIAIIETVCFALLAGSHANFVLGVMLGAVLGSAVIILCDDEDEEEDSDMGDL